MFALTSSSLTGPPVGTLRCNRHDLGAGIVRVALCGELDTGSGAELDRLLDDAAADAAFVALDLDELVLVDPAGAAALRAWGLRAGSRIVAVNVQPRVRATLMTIGVHQVLKLVDTPPVALHGDHAA